MLLSGCAGRRDVVLVDVVVHAGVDTPCAPRPSAVCTDGYGQGGQLRSVAGRVTQDLDSGMAQPWCLGDRVQRRRWLSCEVEPHRSVRVPVSEVSSAPGSVTEFVVWCDRCGATGQTPLDVPWRVGLLTDLSENARTMEERRARVRRPRARPGALCIEVVFGSLRPMPGAVVSVGDGDSRQTWRAGADGVVCVPLEDVGPDDSIVAVDAEDLMQPSRLPLRGLSWATGSPWARVIVRDF